MLILDSTLTPDQQATAMAVLLTVTVVASIFALVVSPLVAVVRCVSLCFEVVGELSVQSALLSIEVDPVVKPLMLVLIAYAVGELLHPGAEVMS